MKPTLKAPGAKRLKPKQVEVLLNFAFKFDLRRYIKGVFATVPGWEDARAQEALGLGQPVRPPNTPYTAPIHPLYTP